MKLQIYNPENSRAVKIGKPTIGISFKTGCFNISTKAAELIGVGGDDMINFAYDEEDEEWYIFKVKEDGFKLRDVGNSSLTFTCKSIAKRIATHLNYINNSGYVLIGSEPVKDGKNVLFNIITGTLKND